LIVGIASKNGFSQKPVTPVPVKWSAEYIKHSFPCNNYFTDFDDVRTKTAFHPHPLGNTGEKSFVITKRRRWRRGASAGSRLDLLRQF
jgi:hypothetical protein